MSRSRAWERRPGAIVAWLTGLGILLLAVMPASPAAADVPPLMRSLEAGAAGGHYSNGYGNSDGQFARFGLWREDRWAWHFEVGRSARFGDQSLDGGLSYAQWFGRTSATVGISSGSGEYIANRYRFDAAVTRPVAQVVTTLGYTRIQSKGENRSDGLGLSLVRYLPHWILSAQGRCDWGQPGDTHALSGGVGLSYVVWRRLNVGIGYDAGDVSYLVVGPGQALVDYHSTGWNVGASQWFGAHWGMNERLEYGETPFYNVRGASVSLFREW